ncbi:MAG: thiamine-phosphate kinase [Ectothiorhodospiraceae bacterium AqS1]|nr:thiamine-phosphate kinase [Ectothiorhodospiraceae bacterium AqS1]
MDRRIPFSEGPSNSRPAGDRDSIGEQESLIFDSVVAIDTLNEGVHFPKRGSSPADRGAPTACDVGYKALAVNLSDLAAMGAQPLGARAAVFFPLSSAFADPRISSPAGLDPEGWTSAFRRGFDALAEDCGVEERDIEFRPFAACGSTEDGSLADALSITVNIHGICPRGQALTRRGARPGDRILVSGTLGDAGGGLAIASGRWAPEPAASASFLLSRLHRPSPRLALGRALRGWATAAIDISDGLCQDLGHILAWSGVGAWIDRRRLPVSRALERISGSEGARGLALEAGDDYELLFTLPPAQEGGVPRPGSSIQGTSKDRLRIADTAVREIGRIEAGSGLRIIDGVDELLVPPSGYRHFSGARARDIPDRFL